MLIAFGFLQIVFSRRCKGPSNNLFARHPGSAPLTRPTTGGPQGSAECVLLSERCFWCRVAGRLARSSYLFLRKLRSEVLEKSRYARTLLTPGNAKFYSRSHDAVIRRSRLNQPTPRLRRGGRPTPNALTHSLTHLKLGRVPRFLAATLATLPSMSLFPKAPFGLSVYNPSMSFATP